MASLKVIKKEFFLGLAIMGVLISISIPIAQANEVEQLEVASSPEQSEISREALEVLNIVNRERIQIGLHPLAMHVNLARGAQIRAEEVSILASHTRPDGRSWRTVFSEVGINNAGFDGENVAGGQRTPQTVMDAWMSSSGHRANISHANFRFMGVGHYFSLSSWNRHYWAQLFMAGPQINGIRMYDEEYTIPLGAAIEDTGAWVWINTSDGSRAFIPIITEMISGLDNSIPGIQEVTVHYQNWTTTFTVNVDESAVATCHVIAEGRFGNQPANAGGMAGAPWKLCQGGRVEIGEGFISWDGRTPGQPSIEWNPWSARDGTQGIQLQINQIVFTGPISAGNSLILLFVGLPHTTEIEGLAYLDISAVTSMRRMFANTSRLISLDLSSWDTSNVDMDGMFANTAALRELTLGEQFVFRGDPALPEIRQTAEFTGYWRNVGDGTKYLPNGNYRLTSAQLMEQFDGSTMADTWVWERVERIVGTCNIMAEGQFVHPPLGPAIGLLGASWRLCGDGSLEVDEGFISWTGTVSPWNAYRTRINRIVFTGEITASGSLMGLFSHLNNVETIEGLDHFNTGSVTNMGALFNGASSLTSLNLSGFNMSRVVNMDNMFASTASLKELTLGETFRFVGHAGLPTVPTTSEFTGMWQNVGDGTVENPMGEFAFISAELMTQFDGATMADTWVWQSMRETLVCPTIAEGRFANQAGADGIAGAPWRLCEDGTLEVDEGFINWTATQSPWDRHSANIREIVFADSITAGTSLRNLFRNLTNVTIIEGLEYFDTSNVRDMNRMFSRTVSLVELDVSNFDTSNVTNMSEMFRDASGLISLDVLDWDTRSVTNMSEMFRNASGLTSLNVSRWNTNRVSNMSGMFSGASALTELDVSNWGTSNVTNMNSMFSSAHGLTKLDVSNWDTSQVVNMSWMFSNARALTSLDVSNWDTSQVSNMSAMFNWATSLSSLEAANWDTSQVTDMSIMFRGASGLTSLNLSNWDTSRVIHMGDMFAGANALRTLTLGKNFAFRTNAALSTRSVTNEFTGLWQNVSNGTVENPTGEFAFTSAQLMSQFDGSTMADIFVWQRWEEVCEVIARGRFAHQAGANGIAGSPWVLCGDGVLEVGEGFINNSPGPPISPWNTYRNQITEIIFTGEITTGVSLGNLFQDLTNVTTIEGLEKFNTSSVTNMSEMFSRASRLTSLDLSSFDSRQVANMSWMLNGTTNLRSLTLGEDFAFVGSPNLPIIRRSADFTGYWQNIGDGTVENPMGEFVFTSTELMAQFDGARMADTWVWQPVREAPVCTMIAEGQFENQPANQGGLLGASWILCNNGVLEVGEGFINWEGVITSGTVMQSPWHDQRTNVREIVFTGPVTAGSSLRGLFGSLENLTKIEGLDNFDTSQVTDMNRMFSNANGLTSLDLSGFNTSQVVDMSLMFWQTRSLRSLDVSTWDTSQVTNMWGMFWVASALTSLDLSSFDTSQVTDMSSMFANTNSLTSLDISSFDTSRVTSMSRMFADTSLINLDLSNFDTSQVTAMTRMFHNATNTSRLTTLDLSSFTANQNLTTVNMFENATSLRELTLEEFEFNGNPNLPAVRRADNFTGYWQNVGAGTVARPRGNYILTSAQLMAQFDGSKMADTWVWQRWDHLQVVTTEIERLTIGRFAGVIDHGAETITFNIPEQYVDHTGRFEGVITEIEAIDDTLLFFVAGREWPLRTGNVVGFWTGDLVYVAGGDIQYRLIINPAYSKEQTITRLTVDSGLQGIFESTVDQFARTIIFNVPSQYLDRDGRLQGTIAGMEASGDTLIFFVGGRDWPLQLGGRVGFGNGDTVRVLGGIKYTLIIVPQ